MGAAIDVAGRASLPVLNPATGKVFAHAPSVAPSAVDALVVAAQAAQRAWAESTVEHRQESLRDAGRLLGERVDEVAWLLTLEQGKPLAKARDEVLLAADWFGLTAALALEPETLCDNDSSHIVMTRVPFGVCAAITPSNYPIILAVCKMAPALLAGNTVILKPSSDTPLASVAMVDAVRAALPPDMVQTLNGEPELGSTLVRHPGVAKVSFTGSVEVGARLAAAAGAGLKSVTLELGGNDPAIVLPGTDIDALAESLFWGAFENSGQFCSAIKRVYVSARDHARLADRLADIAKSACVGPGLEASTQLGPLTTARQQAKVADFVGDAVAGGARVLTGGESLEGPGYFYAPTILVDPPDGSAIEQEEQFGPALPVIAYDTLDEAVRRANGTRYGLGGSVWGDPQQAAPVALRLDAGTVWINTHGDLRADAPFGGRRASGIGVEYGYWGLLEYAQIKVTNARRTA